MGAERASDGPTRIGPYRLLHRLGEGGMGVVHMGLDSTGRAVAIKVLRAHIAHDPDARARLKREVSTLARVRHPLVAEVLDADVDGERPYVVTRYVPGPGLDDVVARNGPLPVDELTRVGRGLSDALGAIHAAGVVHRDLKPGNVLMLDGEPVVIDFGIAHVADDVRLTSVGLVMGTPGYLSPEVIDGEPVSTATDWWGWAATLSFAASGRPPFGRGPMDVVIDRVRRGQCDLEGVDPRLQPLLLSALDVDPARRPVAGEVLAELDRYAAHSGSTVVLPQGASATQRLSSGTQLLPAGGASATRVLHGAVASGSTAGHVSTHAPGAGRAATRAAAPDSAPAAARNQAPATAPTHALAPELVAATGTPPSPWWVPKAQAARSENGVAHAAAPDDLWRQPAQPGAGAGSGATAYGATHSGATPYGAMPYAVAPYAAAPDASTPDAVRHPAEPEPSAEGYEALPSRARRPGTLLAVLVALVGAAVAWPVATAAVTVLLMVLARTVERSASALSRRRYERGLRRTDGLVAAVASPWHLLGAVLATAVSILLPAVLGVATAFSAGLLVTAPDGGASPASPPAIGAGALVALLTAWWGPGGSTLRRGSRMVVRAVVRPSAAPFVVLILLAIGAAAGLVALQADEPMWWPLQQAPSVPLPSLR